jgi:hypothetical protein
MWECDESRDVQIPVPLNIPGGSGYIQRHSKRDQQRRCQSSQRFVRSGTL